MMTEPIIKVRQIKKSFGLPHQKRGSIKSHFLDLFRGSNYEKQEVLKGVSFEINRGEFFGVIGRNGSGKSTLLKLLAGIYATDNGSIEIAGRLTPFIELGVGFNPELTGRENVYLNGALLGFSRKEMQSMYRDIVEFAELEKFMDQKLKNYSSGMQVRLAFSIAIRAESDILLIDEVLAVGDSAFQEKCFKVFENIKGQGRTVVFISHDAGAIERFCDRVILIEGGKILNHGNPKDILLEYAALMANEEYTKVAVNQTKQRKQGTGFIEIKNVSIIDESGKKTKVLKESKNFSIKIEYINKLKKKYKAVVGVGLISDDGVSVLGPNTKESRLPIEIKDNGYIEVFFETNPLSPGEYSITAGIFNESESVAFSLVENATQVKIIGTPRHGKIYIEPEWRIKEK